MSVTGDILGGEVNGSRIHLYTDDGQVNLWFKGAPHLPRTGETVALGGVVHQVSDVHWTADDAPTVFGGTMKGFQYLAAHLRLQAIAQAPVVGGDLR